MENSIQENPQTNLPKIEVFKTTQKYFAMIGISPKSTMQRFNGKMLMSFLALMIGVSFTSVYVFNYVDTFVEFTQGCFILSAGTTVTCLLLVSIFKVEKMFEFINRCDIVVNTTSKYSATRSIYYETNQLEEKLSKTIFFLMIELTPAGVFIPWISYIFFIYFTTDLGPNAFELPCPMWFPFDCKNLSGFLLAITIECVIFSWGELIGACVLVLSIVSYMYVIAMSKCIKGSLFAINRNGQAKTDQSILVEEVIEFLKLHSNAKQVASNFSNIIEHFIMILFMCSLVVMCGAMLMIQIQLQQHSDNLAMLLVTIIETSYAFGVMFVVCEICQQMNFAFDECSQMVDQFNWYLFPVKVQRMLPTIINFTQQPVEIKCFGSAACDRETFKCVNKKAFSYFTMLRQFYK